MKEGGCRQQRIEYRCLANENIDFIDFGNRIYRDFADLIDVDDEAFGVKNGTYLALVDEIVSISERCGVNNGAWDIDQFPDG